MSFSGIGAGAGSGLRFTQTRGRIQGSSGNGVNYPSPFFDIAQTYYPNTVKQLFRWCRYYFLTNPLINATIFKMSEYPITDIIIDHESPETRKRWEEFFKDSLRINSFRVESGLDYHTYGSGFVTVSFPFKKYLKCRGCKFSEQAARIRQHWVFTNHQFRLTCPKCNHIGDAETNDVYLKNPSGIKLIRWNPEDIEIDYNDITGEYTYYYIVPGTIRSDIVAGRKSVVEKIPQIFIQAVKEQKGVIFTQDSLFHFKRPTLAGQDRGWGIPLLLPVLKDTFYLQIMKKAQEAILLEHIVPLRVLFPQAGSGSSDPYTTINLADWRDHVSQEIARWRFDQNYIPILPLPIGNQTIGGDGRALLMTQEIQTWSEQIIAGMQVPKEFIYGGMSYSGTSVSMRILENAFLNYSERQLDMCRYIMRAVASFMGWPEVGIRFKPFKMADDLQRKAYRFQLNQAQKISDTTLLSDDDLSQEEENEMMIREADMRAYTMKKQQMAIAEMQGESQLIMGKYQVKAQQMQQQAMNAPPAAGEPGAPPDGSTMGTPGGQEGEGVPMPPDLQVAAPGGGSVEGAPPAAAPAQDPMQGMQSQLNAGQQMQPGQPQVDLQSLAMRWAQQISAMDPQSQQMAIDNLKLQSPPLGQLVEQMVGQQGGGQQQQQGPGVDMRPLPEQRAPRRQTALV